MAKDKKSKKSKADAEPIQLIAGSEPAAKGKKKKKNSGGKAHGAMDALTKLAEHPLVGDLMEAGKNDPASVKSAKAAKAAGKAAAAAIGARLLKEFAPSGGKKDAQA